MHIDEKKLILALLKTISGGWISAIQFERLAKDLQIPDGAPTIFFLTGVKGVLRELPFKVYADDDTRLALLDAIQTAIDAAIDREESVQNEETTK